jgi:hypothetical protein
MWHLLQNMGRPTIAEHQPAISAPKDNVNATGAILGVTISEKHRGS